MYLLLCPHHTLANMRSFSSNTWVPSTMCEPSRQDCSRVRSLGSTVPAPACALHGLQLPSGKRTYLAPPTRVGSSMVCWGHHLLHKLRGIYFVLSSSFIMALSICRFVFLTFFFLLPPSCCAVLGSNETVLEPLRTGSVKHGGKLLVSSQRGTLCSPPTHNLAM